MAFRQQQPVVARVLDQPAARLHQPLLQTAQRPVVNSPRQHQPPPQVPQVVGNYAQPKPHLVRPESMATQPRHLHRLLAFLDPLLRLPPLVVEPHHRPAVGFQARHNEPTRGNRSPKWNSTLATTRRAIFQLAAWYKKLLYQTTGL